MKISNKKYARALYEILSTAGEKERKVHIYNFLQLLSKHKKLSETNSILKKFEEIEKEQQGIIEAQVTSAFPLSKDAQKIITHFLQNEFNSQNIQITETNDKNVLGGVKIRVHDTTFDTTLETQLQQLKQQMSK